MACTTILVIKFMKKLLQATHNFRSDSRRYLHHRVLVYKVIQYNYVIIICMYVTVHMFIYLKNYLFTISSPTEQVVCNYDVLASKNMNKNIILHR